MKFIIGKKLDMTQKFTEDGKVVPVTRIVAGPCFVTAKNKYIDHKGIQIAWEKVDTKKVSKPVKKITKKVVKKVAKKSVTKKPTKKLNSKKPVKKSVTKKKVTKSKIKK